MVVINRRSRLLFVRGELSDKPTARESRNSRLDSSATYFCDDDGWFSGEVLAASCFVAEAEKIRERLERRNGISRKESRENRGMREGRAALVERIEVGGQYCTVCGFVGVVKSEEVPSLGTYGMWRERLSTEEQAHTTVVLGSRDARLRLVR
jgi:hypothetical protein